MKTDLIELGKLQKHSHELIEVTIIKEYLIKQQDKMWKEIVDIEYKNIYKSVPPHILCIITSVLKERKKLIDHLLKEIIDKYWSIKNENENENNNSTLDR